MQDKSKKIPIDDHNINLESAKKSDVYFDLGLEGAAKKEIIEVNEPNISPNDQALIVSEQKQGDDKQGDDKQSESFSLQLEKQIEKLNNETVDSKQSSQSAKKPVQKLNLKNRAWRLAEFVSVTAAVFAIFFVILNFDSLSTLFWSKVDQMTGKITTENPYTQVNNPQDGQTPLALNRNNETSKNAFPELSLEIAPPDDRIILPRINKNVPVVRVSIETLIRKDWAALENQLQEALQHGVVHYPGTAFPGQKGNVVITGHSSYFPWDPGRFKDVFALLHQVSEGDEIIVFQDQKKYRYVVYEKKVVRPNQVEVLAQEGDDRLTLITCTPIGTDLNRLIVLAKPVEV